MIAKIAALLLGDLFKKKPWRLWGIRPNDKKWRDFGVGSVRRLRIYAATLFVEGWRTLICAKGVEAPAVPPNNEIKMEEEIP